MTLPILPGVSIALIQRIVANRYEVPLSCMTAPERARESAWPRQMAMYLSREFTRHSLTMIGRRFGGRDHTTVLHACRAVPRRAQHDLETERHLRFLWAMLDQMTPKPAEEQMGNLYEELGVERNATPEEIKAAHRRAVREHHPDRGGDKARFQAVQLAYDTLKDGARRKRYDETGETAQASQPDMAVQMLGMIVEGLIGQMLQEGAPIETADMRKMMLDAVKGKKQEIAREKASNERAMAKARELSRRWKRKRKAKGPDLIGETLRRRERDLAEAMKRMTEAEEAWTRAAELLDDYEYRFEERKSGTTYSAAGFQFVSMATPR